jgi:branched-subunit amino acid ABC-type transport system permease component
VPLPELIQLIVNGLITGSVITLGAVGLSLVMGTLDIGSFAHGDYLTFGAYAAFCINILWGQNIIVAMIGAALATAVMSVVVDRVLLQRFREKGANSLLIVTLGLALGMRSLLYVVFGSYPERLDIDATQVFDLTIIRISLPQVISIAIAALSILGLALLLARTTIGKSMRALSDDRDLASVAGINVDRMRVYIWALAGLLAGVAGTMQGMLQAAFDPAMGWNILFLLFTAVILGGVGSTYGTLVGGFLLGIGMEVSTWSGWPNGGLGSDFKPIVAFAVLLAVVLVRPQGVFGKARLL